MFKTFRTPLIIITSMVFGYTTAVLTGCEHPHDTEHNTTPIDSGRVDSLCTDSVVVCVEDITLTVTDDSVTVVE